MSHQIESGQLDGYTYHNVLASSSEDGKRLKLRVYPASKELVFTVVYTTTNPLDESILATKNFDTLAQAIDFYNSK